MAESITTIERPTSLIPPKATFDSPGSGLATSTVTDKEYDLKRELLCDKWRQLFDKYDPEGFGEIPWDDFVEVLKTPEFVAEVAPNKRDILAERAQERKTPAITFQDFVNINEGEKMNVKENKECRRIQLPKKEKLKKKRRTEIIRGEVKNVIKVEKKFSWESGDDEKDFRLCCRQCFKGEEVGSLFNRLA
ncbi:hypothetical protein V9T40_008769 [Parthenolecanium corni]|uniref:EF-hand domain-containing protein n=1 Tax=Parthenolecanium corni TaxID=536013 RepID=A0AAN9U0A6_9HEMI